MSIATRPTIQDMMNAAMAGTAGAAGTAVSRIKVAEEAKRQLDSDEDKPPSNDKKNKKKDEDEEDSGERAEKLAAAAEFCADLLEKNAADLAGSYTLTETPMAPGKGPNALEISESPSGAPVNQKPTGQAVSGNQPPMNPATQKAMPQERGGTQLENDAGRAPGSGDPPMSGSTKNASAKLARVMKVAKDPGLIRRMGQAGGASDAANADKMSTGLQTGMGALAGGVGGAMMGGATRGLPGAAVGGAIGAAGGAGLGYIGSESTKGYIEGVADERAKMLAKQANVSGIRALKKQAEDAGNPSKISAGAVQQNDQGPPGVLNSSEAGPPAQDKGKVPVGHDATRAFTRAQAKATPKKEMRAVLDEPMMSSKTDKVLDVNLDHDGDSKISSVQEVTKIAAARALLKKVRKQAEN